MRYCPRYNSYLKVPSAQIGKSTSNTMFEGFQNHDFWEIGETSIQQSYL